MLSYVAVRTKKIKLITASYATNVTLGEMSAAAGGPEIAYRDYIGANLIGTPEQLWEQYLARKAMVGDYEILANFGFGGMPYELVYSKPNPLPTR
jgi:hypothetical protein